MGGAGKFSQIHGIINAISWGILLPIGLLAARYLRHFNFADPAWFYIHAFCQITGYAGGTAGWILGLRLQKLANPIKYYHRNLGIAVWALATLQVFICPVSDLLAIACLKILCRLQRGDWKVIDLKHAHVPLLEISL